MIRLTILSRVYGPALTLIEADFWGESDRRPDHQSCILLLFCQNCCIYVAAAFGGDGMRRLSRFISALCGDAGGRDHRARLRGKRESAARTNQPKVVRTLLRQ
jgi:hypothetical protein